MEGFFHQGSTRDARPKVWKNLLSILWQRGPSLTDSWPVQLDQNLVQGKCEEIGKLSQQKYLPARPDGFFLYSGTLRLLWDSGEATKAASLGSQENRSGLVLCGPGATVRSFSFETVFDRKEFLKLIKRNQTVVLVGETGSGKTTQLPQFLLEANWYIEMIHIF